MTDVIFGEKPYSDTEFKISMEEFVRDSSFYNYFRIEHFLINYFISEETLQKYVDYFLGLQWKYVLDEQEVSQEFILKNIDKIDKTELLLSNRVPQDIKDYVRMFL